MEVIGGILVAAFVLFIGSKAGFVTIKFHKREDAPSSGSGTGGGSPREGDPPKDHQ